MSVPPDPAGDPTLAGEYALRLLSPAEEAAAAARVEAEPAFAAKVEDWNERLGGLVEEITPVEPSPGVWPRIVAAVHGANDNAVIFWRRWAVGSSTLAAASVAALVFMAIRPDPAPVPPPAAPVAVTRVAALTLSNTATAAVTLVYDPATGNLFVAPSDKMEGDPRVPHLWLVMPEGGVRLIGAIDGTTSTRHTLTGDMSVMAGSAQAVAISMEAPGHHPAADKPDGPVIASGALSQL